MIMRAACPSSASGCAHPPILIASPFFAPHSPPPPPHAPQAGYSGAFQHGLFGWLNHHCDGATLAAWLPELDVHWLAAAEMTLVNQLLVVPLLYMPLFHLVKGLAKGRGPRMCAADLRRQGFALLRIGWAFWLPVQCTLFALCPIELLVTSMAMAGVCWNFILSTLSNRGHAQRATVAVTAPAPLPLAEVSS